MKYNNWKQYCKLGVAAALLTAAGLYYWIAGRSDGMISLDKERSEVVLETLAVDMETFAGGMDMAPGTETGTETERSDVPEPRMYYVHMCGEVKEPGVYKLPEGSRIFEAVEAAGGLTDLAAEQSLNQALAIEDGMQIVILNKEEAAAQAKIQKESALGLVNLNTATREQLMTLPGIGESRADAIIRYRDQSGGFQTVEEIMKVSGIKEAAYEKIKEKITI